MAHVCVCGAPIDLLPVTGSLIERSLIELTTECVAKGYFGPGLRHQTVKKDKANSHGVYSMIHTHDSVAARVSRQCSSEPSGSSPDAGTRSGGKRSEKQRRYSNDDRGLGWLCEGCRRQPHRQPISRPACRSWCCHAIALAISCVGSLLPAVGELGFPDDAIINLNFGGVSLRDHLGGTCLPMSVGLSVASSSSSRLRHLRGWWGRHHLRTSGAVQTARCRPARRLLCSRTCRRWQATACCTCTVHLVGGVLSESWAWQ